jgi:hypothetical protein
MRKDDDRGVDARQGLVDLKEREAERAAQAAEEQRRKIAEEERRVAEERRAAAGERERVAAEQARIDQERAALAESDAPPEEKAAAEQKLQEEETALAETNRRLDEESEARDEQSRALDEQRREAAQNEALAEQRAAEARNERQAIADDQTAIIAGGGGGGSGAARTGILAIRLTDPASTLGTPVHVEPVTGAELQRGSLNMVNVHTLTTIGGRIFAVAGANIASGAIRLIEIDPNTLGMKAQGNDDIVEGSPLWTNGAASANGASLYALVSVDGASQLARFNLDLARLAVTRSGVHPHANIVFAENRLLVQGPNGGVLSLDPNSLTR